MGFERRDAVRRNSDALVHEVLSINQTIADLLQGKKGNITERLTRLRGISNELGRREEDRKRGKELCEAAETMTDLLIEMRFIERLPRRISLRKISGKKLDRFPVGLQLEGWEMAPPKCQQRYFVYLDDGKIFRTSRLLEQADDHLRTCYSVYRLWVVEEFHIGNLRSNDVSTH